MAVTITTTVTLIATLGLSTLFGIIATIALVVLLVQRELGIAIGAKMQTYVRGLTLAITPLVMTVAVILVRRLVTLI